MISFPISYKDSIHLLTVMVMEYILLVVQLRLAAEQEGQVWQKVKQYAVVDQGISLSFLSISA